VALVGVLLTILVPTRRGPDLHSTPVEPSRRATLPETGTDRLNPTA